MAYRKRMVKRARNNNALQKRVNVYGKAGYQLYKDVMYLKGLVNAEPKIHSVSASNNFGYNGVIVSLCDVPVGDNTNHRDGNRILPRYMNIKFHVNRLIASPTNSHSTIRYIVFRWWGESPNVAGVAPAVTDIIAFTGTQYAPISQLNSAVTGSKGDRNRRIEVHRSSFITLDSVSKTAFDEDFNITLNGDNAPKEHIEYYDSTTNPPTSGGFFILFINDNSVTSDVAFYLSSRLTFYDN